MSACRLRMQKILSLVSKAWSVGAVEGNQLSSKDSKGATTEGLGNVGVIGTRLPSCNFGYEHFSTPAISDRPVLT